MEKFKECKDEIINQLQKIKYEGGIDDIGNEIGIVVVKYFNELDDRFAFISGIEHGISLTDGTHDEIKTKHSKQDLEHFKQKERSLEIIKKSKKKAKKKQEEYNNIIDNIIEIYPLMSDRHKTEVLEAIFYAPPKYRKYKR